MKKFSIALIIKKEWLDLIISGQKTLEMRTRHTKKRGWIGLIEKGSGFIMGEAWLDDSIELKASLKSLKDGHCIDYEKNPELLKYNIAWRLERVRKFEKPMPYKHKKGAVVWVKV